MNDNVKKQSKYNIFTIMCRLYKVAFKECPVRMLVYSLVLFANGVIQIAITYGTELFYDNVSLGARERTISSAIMFSFLFLMAAILVSHILNGCDNYLGTSVHVVLIGKFEERMHKKVVKLDPLLFEDTKFLDDINKAFQGSGVSGCTYVLEAFMVIMLSQVPYMILMSIYLYKLSPVLAFCIFLIFVPVAISQYIRIQVFEKLEDETASCRRKYDYYTECVAGREYFKETRMLGAYNYFSRLIGETIKKINDKAWKCYGKMARLEILMRFITLAGYVGVILLLVYYVINGRIGVGAFAAVFSSIAVMFDMIESALGQQLGGVFETIGMVTNYVKFLDMEEMQGEEAVVDYSGGIQLHNVSFSYKGSEKMAVKNVSLTVRSGETLAIVGENGAGKSTLVKLLIGLYRPDEGEVYIGQSNTGNTKMQCYQDKISGVFQNYQKYKMTLKDNVVISAFEGQESDKVNRTLKNVGIDINGEEYPEGLDTILSTEFGGTDISGGQWQRVAIARGMYKEHEVIVLDEPTSAIDPIEEYALYNKFKEMSKDKTAILVTHRMGSCKIADHIIVMDEGQIIEEGTHEDLMNKNGKYKEMYVAQAQWYA